MKCTGDCNWNTWMFRVAEREYYEVPDTFGNPPKGLPLRRVEVKDVPRKWREPVFALGSATPPMPISEFYKHVNITPSTGVAFTRTELEVHGPSVDPPKKRRAADRSL